MNTLAKHSAVAFERSAPKIITWLGNKEYMEMLTTLNQIALFRLKVIRQGIKLEQLGMTKSGRSCTVIAKEMFGLPKATKREKVLEVVEKAIQTSTV